MKRNWLFGTALGSALIVASFSSNLFAGHGHGGGFGGFGGGGGGGNSFRSSGGSNMGMQSMKSTHFNSGIQSFRSNSVNSGSFSKLQQSSGGSFSPRKIGGLNNNLGSSLQRNVTGGPKLSNKISNHLGISPQNLRTAPTSGHKFNAKLGNVGLGTKIATKPLDPKLGIGPKLGNQIGSQGITLHQGNKLNGKLGNNLGGKIVSGLGVKVAPSGQAKPFCGTPSGSNCHGKSCDPWWWNCWNNHCYKPCKPVVICPPPYTGPVYVPVTTVVQSPVEVPVAVPADGAVAEGVAPASAEAPLAEGELVQVNMGATVTLQEPTLDAAQGQVLLQIDKVMLPTLVSEWKEGEVTFTLPGLGLTSPTKGQIWLVKADGKVANSLAVELLPAPAADATGEAAATPDEVAGPAIESPAEVAAAAALAE
jgi:hypothetical protein